MFSQRSSVPIHRLLEKLWYIQNADYLRWENAKISSFICYLSDKLIEVPDVLLGQMEPWRTIAQSGLASTATGSFALSPSHQYLSATKTKNMAEKPKKLTCLLDA